MRVDVLPLERGNGARPAAARLSRSSEPYPPRDSIDEPLRNVDEALEEMGEALDEFEKLEGRRHKPAEEKETAGA